jgi:hypothetical protein
MVHGGGNIETAVRVALAASNAAHGLTRDRFLLYFDLIHRALSDDARKAFQMLPQGRQFFSDSLQQSFEQGKAHGKAQGRAVDVIAVLEARGLAITEAQRQRILATTDMETLDRWLRCAATAVSSDALFE